MRGCTATENLGYSLRQDCGIISIYLKGVSDGETNAETSQPSVKLKLFLRHLGVKVHKRNRVGNPITSAKTGSQSGSSNSLTMLRLSESSDKASQETVGRIAHLEHLIGQSTVASDIEKRLAETPKQKHLVELTGPEKLELVETLRTNYSVRSISETLGFNPSLFYYQSKSDASDENLQDEIQRLAGRYPKYGYRRITELLVRLGYTVGYRRVARLMKEDNLSVTVKRVSCQTTQSLEGVKPWVNRL